MRRSTYISRSDCECHWPPDDFTITCIFAKEIDDDGVVRAAGVPVNDDFSFGLLMIYSQCAASVG